MRNFRYLFSIVLLSTFLFSQRDYSEIDLGFLQDFIDANEGLEGENP